jgi:hypothetical protein
VVTPGAGIRPAILATLGLLLLLGMVWFGIRYRLGSSVVGHPVVQAVELLAQERGWSLLLDEIDGPGPLEPLWLAGMMGEPWRRTLVYRTHAAPNETGPALEALLFGRPGGPPEGPVEGTVWRTSRTLPFLPPSVRTLDGREGSRGSFVGVPERVTYWDRTRRLRVSVDGEVMAVVVEGGARRRGGDGSGHPLTSTEPHRW